MAIKNWNKRGDDWYEHKFERRSVTVDKPAGEPGYILWHSYPYDAAHPDAHWYPTKTKAHVALMKIVRRY